MANKILFISYSFILCAIYRFFAVSLPILKHKKHLKKGAFLVSF
jgi:hypothetical protein